MDKINERFRRLAQLVRAAPRASGEGDLIKLCNAVESLLDQVKDSRPEASFVRCDLSLDDFSKLEIKPGPIEFVPTPQYVEIGYLLKNEYGFVSASVQDLKALPVGQTPVYSRVPQAQITKEKP